MNFRPAWLTIYLSSFVYCTAKLHQWSIAPILLYQSQRQPKHPVLGGDESVNGTNTNVAIINDSVSIQIYIRLDYFFNYTNCSDECNVFTIGDENVTFLSLFIGSDSAPTIIISKSMTMILIFLMVMSLVH